MKILVVDDHEATVALMELALAAAGNTVLTASTVPAAVDLTVGEQPDIVLSDLTFDRGPATDGDGLVLAQTLRARPDTRYVGLLAVTGITSSTALRAAIDEGFDGVAVKPVDLPSLLDQVSRLGDTVAARRPVE